MVWTDALLVEKGITSAFDIDIAFGQDENDFSLTVDTSIDIPYGGLVYIDGTPYGGIVRGIEYQKEDGVEKNIFSGDTWQGILAKSIICPNSGQDYYIVTGDINACLQTLISRQNLGSLFDVSQSSYGRTISYQFERYCSAYSGITKMLTANNAKLRITKEASSKPKIEAVPISDYSNDGQSYGFEFSMRDYKPVNHLICLGNGDLAARTVINLYADANGNVSQVQSLFGIDEIAEVYDYSNADDEKLLSDGTKKLREYQSTKEADITVPDDLELEIGDIVGVIDESTGRSLISSVAKVIVKVSGSGITTKNYGLADINISFK